MPKCKLLRYYINAYAVHLQVNINNSIKETLREAAMA